MTNLRKQADMSKLTCTFPECGRTRRYAELCDSHRWQQRQGYELTPLRVKRRHADRFNSETGMFECRTCLEWKPREGFRSDNASGGNVSSECLVCSNKRSNISAKVDTDTKRAILNEMKLKAGCADCGYRAHPAGLDFDHLPGFEKSFTISAMTASRSLADLLAEVAKCEVVCATCHRVRTATRLQPI